MWTFHHASTLEHRCHATSTAYLVRKTRVLKVENCFLCCLFVFLVVVVVVLVVVVVVVVVVVGDFQRKTYLFSFSFKSKSILYFRCRGHLL